MREAYRDLPELVQLHRERKAEEARYRRKNVYIHTHVIHINEAKQMLTVIVGRGAVSHEDSQVSELQRLVMERITRQAIPQERLVISATLDNGVTVEKPVCQKAQRLVNVTLRQMPGLKYVTRYDDISQKFVVIREDKLFSYWESKNRRKVQTSREED